MTCVEWWIRIAERILSVFFRPECLAVWRRKRREWFTDAWESIRDKGRERFVALFVLLVTPVAGYLHALFWALLFHVFPPDTALAAYITLPLAAWLGGLHCWEFCGKEVGRLRETEDARKCREALERRRDCKRGFWLYFLSSFWRRLYSTTIVYGVMFPFFYSALVTGKGFLFRIRHLLAVLSPQRHTDSIETLRLAIIEVWADIIVFSAVIMVVLLAIAPLGAAMGWVLLVFRTGGLRRAKRLS